MTENEAIDKLKNMRLFMQIEDNKNECKFTEDDYVANKMALQALEEVQKYRQIGTVEECREAVKKQTAKKPTLIDYKKYANFVDNAHFLRDAYWCPNCKQVVRSGSFCDGCGQKLDWSDVE